MRRMKLKKVKLAHKFIIVVVIILFFTIVSLKIFSTNMRPVFLRIAKSEAKKMATIVINDSVGKQLVINNFRIKINNDLTIDNLFDITKDNNGNITSIDFNSKVVNKVLTTTTNSAIMHLKYVEDGRVDLLNISDNVLANYDQKKLRKGIIYSIPMGIIFGNTLLANIGPKLPVKFSLIGSVNSNINTKITNYGINNALIEVYVDLSVELEVILPLMTDIVEIKSSIPVAIKLIQGNVPEYYANALSNPSLSIPIK